MIDFILWSKKPPKDFYFEVYQQNRIKTEVEVGSVSANFKIKDHVTENIKCK